LGESQVVALVDVHGKHNGQILDVAGVCVNRIGTGSSPGSSRWISPRKLFKVAGYGVYVEAYCENRKEVRTFLTEKISFAHKHDPQRSLASAGMPTDSSSSSQFQSSSKTTGGALIYWVIGIGLLLLAIYW